MTAVIQLCEQAGQVILPHFQSKLTIKTKADGSSVTQADELSHQTLASGLPGLLDVPVLSEESPWPKEVEKLETFWLIDPLDGTKSFIAGSDEFTVNVALIHQHYPVLGVIHAPVTGEFWAGGVGLAAIKKSSIQAREKPIAGANYCSDRPLRISVSINHRDQQTNALIERRQAQQLSTQELPCASSLKLCHVADGTSDIYPRFAPTNQWDIAAGHAIVNASGGKVFNEQMQPLVYGYQACLNPNFIAFADVGLDWKQYF